MSWTLWHLDVLARTFLFIYVILFKLVDHSRYIDVKFAEISVSEFLNCFHVSARKKMIRMFISYFVSMILILS